jgi:5-methylthioadenosine/S-adenosylhomocysteine deaminase
LDWLQGMLFKVGPSLSDSQIRAAVELSCLEMIRTGVTCVVDHHHLRTSEKVIDGNASTLLKSGLRGFVARGMRARTARNAKWRTPDTVFEFDESEEIRVTERVVKSWKRKGEGRVGVCPGPVAIHSTSATMLEEAHRISKENEVPFHIHVAETRDEVSATQEDYGCGEVELLDRLGILDRSTHVVHGVWLSEGEIATLEAKRANVIHCPISNMFLASGIAPVKSLVRAGVSLALGTDGPASNDSHDMFEVMKAASLLAKVSTLDPEAMSARQALYMATMGGARALGMDDSIGSLEKRKRGDLVVVDFRRANSTPVHNYLSSAVYCCRSDNVKTVLADGVPLLLDGKLTQLDESRILANAEAAAAEIRPRAP